MDSQFALRVLWFAEFKSGVLFFVTERDMEEEFTCPICMDVAEDAVETSCCHHIFCEECLVDVRNNCCPQCRAPLSAQPSHLARRLIGNMPVACPYKCDAKVTRSELKSHSNNCPQRMYDCPSPKCGFKALKEEFANHLFNEHKDVIVREASRCFVSSEVQGAVLGPGNGVNKDVGPQNMDRIATTRNANGHTARLGSTGKYYCGRNLDGRRCRCCDGHCGPTNGCNCSACMKLDVERRCLPRGWLVNRHGCPARISGRRFYCGRKVMADDSRCDGYCGPTNGPNCEACQILQEQSSTRYRFVLTQ